MMGTVMRRSGSIIGLCLVLGALFFLAANRGQGKADPPTDGKGGKTESGTKTTHGHGEEVHVPTASDEVSDQTKEWHLLHSLGIKLPLVGWFTIAGYPVPTKYMWLTLLAAVLVAVVYLKLARHIATGEP